MSILKNYTFVQYLLFFPCVIPVHSACQEKAVGIAIERIQTLTTREDTFRSNYFLAKAPKTLGKATACSIIPVCLIGRVYSNS